MNAGRRLLLARLCASAGALAFARVARADAVSDTLADITRARASLKTLVASFTQERTIGLLATAVKSDGEMSLVRPDRLRWELKPPDAVTYWITPEGFAYVLAYFGEDIDAVTAIMDRSLRARPTSRSTISRDRCGSIHAIPMAGHWWRMASPTSSRGTWARRGPCCRCHYNSTRIGSRRTVFSLPVTRTWANWTRRKP